MRTVFMGFRTAAVLATVIAALSPAAAQQPSPGAPPKDGDVVDTGFLPSRDLPSVPNRKGTAFAREGQCNGIDEMSGEYFKWRKANGGKAPPLAQITDAIQTRQRGDAYIEKAMDLATAKSFSKGVLRTDQAAAIRDPGGFAETIVRRMERTGEPQSIVVSGDPRSDPMVGHRMRVYRAEHVAGHWELEVGDSNLTRQGDVDKVRLVYMPGANGRPGVWEEKMDGRPVSRWSGGDIVHEPADRPSDYVHMVQSFQKAEPLGKIRDDLGIPAHPLDLIKPGDNRLPVHGPGAASAVRDPKTGGVLLRFDPEMFQQELPPERAAEMDAKYRAFLASKGANAIILRPRSERLDLTLVPLASLLKGATTVGPLTRIRGYVRNAAGDLSIVGLAEPGKPPIPLEFLLVSLRSIYKSGSTPYVSLDGNPENPIGPQTVRVGGLPQECRRTGFVRTMLDADYVMKRITLGRLQPRAPGFRRWLDIVAQTGDHSGSFNRLWLSPLAAPTADVLLTRSAGAEAALFESHVQAQSESLVNSGGLFAGAGATSADVESAASELTARYSDLADEYPEFAALQGLFDAAKLAAAWRAAGVTSAAIDALLATPLRAVDIPTSYAGIGPDPVPGRELYVFGGVITQQPMYRAGAIRTDCLVPLIEAAGHADSVALTLPAELEMDASQAVAVLVESDAMLARASLSRGEFAKSIDLATVILAIAPDYADALEVRGRALAATGRLQEALADCDALTRSHPATVALRAVVRARLGDVAGARQDCTLALDSAPC
ncbi:MAG TPA: hypothetical protein VKT77_19945, partial [Chthonomonadaceae bacterium]|nr:hypothetical protein [Chthonomonadaceae bacterium]